MQTPALSLYLPDPDAPAASLNRIPFPLAAGFPSPADDYLEDRIDLNRELVRNPTSTFLARVRGESMRDAGLQDGDLILIDRSRPPRTGSMVLAWVDDGFTVKHLALRGDRAFLRAANPDFPDLEYREDGSTHIWGVVTHIIHRQT
jgi:DNA polymerase V